MIGALASIVPFGALSVAAILIVCDTAPASAQGVASPEKQRRLAAELEQRPMVFFRAKGPANSCGPGCDEWIAALGTMTSGTAQRFRIFLSALGPNKPPVIFHSPGGVLGEGLAIGKVLREQRMTATVGRTVPIGCAFFSKSGAECQRLARAGGEVKARLMLDAGQCHSACIHAFVGGSVRRVPAGAVLGVHANRVDVKPSSSKSGSAKVDTRSILSATSHLLQKYFIDMGVDSQIEQIAAKVRHSQIYLLSREEIARLGLETRGHYETRWIAYEEAPQRLVVLKAITQQTPLAEHLTTTIRLSCDVFENSMAVTYRRELPLKGFRPSSALSATIGATNMALRREIRDAETAELGYASAPTDLIEQAAGVPEIVLTETLAATGSAPSRTLSIKLSTDGLAQIAPEFRRRCAPAGMLPNQFRL